MLHKLEREADRLRNALRPADQSDHFYNFCVSAIAMKEHVFAALGVGPDDPNRRSWHQRWRSKCPRLAYCEQVATAYGKSDGRATAHGSETLRSIRIESVPTNVVAMRRTRSDMHSERDDDSVKAPDLTKEVTEFWRTELARLNLLR